MLYNDNWPEAGFPPSRTRGCTLPKTETRNAMDETLATTELLLSQCRRYPALRPADLLKALYQSVFGCGHLVVDGAAGLPVIREELARLPAAQDGPDLEPLDGPFCRLHLRYLPKSGLSPQTLFRLFALSAEPPAGDGAALEKKLACLLALAREGQLPFSHRETARAVSEWREAGFPACRHSEEFRRAYAPAYRVIRREYIRLLPLLSGLDRQLAAKGRVIAALEGGSAAGKTTLAALLSRLYGCRVFHMDDFFLRPQQRTQARLAEPGGNVDWERFYAEVLLPLTRGEAVRYCPYDCHTRTMSSSVEIAPGALNVVEGAYSMHPALAGCYDLSAFLRISPELQRARIQRRNGPEARERFFNTWIPLEQRYFDATDAARRCDLIVEVDE